MVNEEVTAAIPVLQELSNDIASVKNTVLDNFKAILQMKDEVLKRVKNDQKSHTFTTSDGLARITIGRHACDDGRIPSTTEWKLSRKPVWLSSMTTLPGHLSISS